MKFSEPAWQELVEGFTSSLASLQEGARGVVEFTAADLEGSKRGSALEALADRHLKNSQQIGQFLGDRMSDPQAQQALACVASADFDVAAFLHASTEEPEPAMQAFPAISGPLDIAGIRADLLGRGVIRGGQTSPPALEVVEKACDDVLAKAGKCARDLAKDVAGSITLAQVLQGFESVVGGTVANAIEEARREVTRFKRWVLNFMEEGLSKVARWLRLDPDQIRQELSDLWSRVEGRIEDWIGDVLGNSHARSTWQGWLDGPPKPNAGAVEASLKVVAASQASHENLLKWAGGMIWVFGKLGKWAGTLHAAGVFLVVAVAAALGALLAGTTWHFFRAVVGAVG